MPSSKNYVRDYKQEQKTATARGEDAGRVARNKARRQMIAKHGKSALKGMDVDHKKPIRNGGKTEAGNLRIRSVSSNRSSNGHKKGE